LAALRALDILDTEPEDRFDRVTRVARELFDVPICLISFIDEERQWFKSKLGVETKEMPRAASLCGRTVDENCAFAVEDTLADPQFARHPLVTEGPRVRFYASHPLHTVDGHAVGTLCVADHQPREFGIRERALLTDLARIAENELNALQVAVLQREAQSAQEELNRFFSISLDMLCIATFDGVFKKLNPAWSDTLGYELEELVGRPFLEFVHPDDREKTVAEAERLMGGHNVVAFDNRYRCKDGTYRHILWSSAPDPQTQLFMAAARDITEIQRTAEALREAKAAAEQASQAKSRFLANMSHEFRTPLNSVIGFSNVLRKNKEQNLQEEELAYLDRIEANGRHLLALVNDMLDLSKIEAGHMDLSQTEVALDELVHDVLHQLEVQAQEKGVRLHGEFPEMKKVRTDPQRLRQILINLVGNALKFTETGSITVRVHARETDRAPTHIEIADTGIGIPEDQQRTIFEAFAQVDSSTRREHEGTGLGLAICKSLCDLLGYGISLQSTVGEGSTFTIHLDPSAAASDEESLEART
jgi:PAS domain S-box-containing protein